VRALLTEPGWGADRTRVDFDSMKPVVKQFGAQMQSTLIVFKGAAEQGRSVGDTKQDSIAALLDKSL